MSVDSLLDKEVGNFHIWNAWSKEPHSSKKEEEKTEEKMAAELEAKVNGKVSRFKFSQ